MIIEFEIQNSWTYWDQTRYFSVIAHITTIILEQAKIIFTITTLSSKDDSKTSVCLKIFTVSVEAYYNRLRSIALFLKNTWS